MVENDIIQVKNDNNNNVNHNNNNNSANIINTRSMNKFQSNVFIKNTSIAITHYSQENKTKIQNNKKKMCDGMITSLKAQFADLKNIKCLSYLIQNILMILYKIII